MKTSDIAAKLAGQLDGDPDLEISGLADISNVSGNKIAFLAPSSEIEDSSLLPKDACVLVQSDSTVSFVCTTIRVADPKLSFARISGHILPSSIREGRHESALIADDAEVLASFVGAYVSIGEGSFVGDGVVLHNGVQIGRNVTIGKRSVLHPNVVIYDNCEIGSDCVLHSGAVIGSEGFGFLKDGDEIVKFPQIGTAVLEDGVEIGANSCVDRGALGETRIGAFTKIDNLVQIAHNVSIGRRVLIASQVGISGSVVIEDDVVFGGQVGVGDHVTIRSGAIIGGGSGIFPGKILRSGFWAGTPVRPIKKYLEQIALIHSLPRIKKEITELKNKVE